VTKSERDHAIALYHREGYSYRDIAEKVGCSKSLIKVVLERVVPVSNKPLPRSQRTDPVPLPNPRPLLTQEDADTKVKRVNRSLRYTVIKLAARAGKQCNTYSEWAENGAHPDKAETMEALANAIKLNIGAAKGLYDIGVPGWVDPDGLKSQKLITYLTQFADAELADVDDDTIDP